MIKSDGFSMAQIISIVVQMFSFYVSTSISISDSTAVTTEFYEKTSTIGAQIDKFYNLTSFDHLTPNLQPKLRNSEPEFENSSTSSTITYGGILGTPAAYKLDIRDPLIGCSLSEFACKNGRCIPASKYCDKVLDCGGGDNSDEPRFCTCKLIKLIFS